MTTAATLTVVALIAWGAIGTITDRIRDRRTPPMRRDANAARLPGNARHCNRVEAGTFDALYSGSPYARTGRKQ